MPMNPLRPFPQLLATNVELHWAPLVLKGRIAWCHPPAPDVATTLAPHTGGVAGGVLLLLSFL